MNGKCPKAAEYRGPKKQPKQMLQFQVIIRKPLRVHAVPRDKCVRPPMMARVIHPMGSDSRDAIGSSAVFLIARRVVVIGPVIISTPAVKLTRGFRLRSYHLNNGRYSVLCTGPENSSSSLLRMLCAMVYRL